MSIPWEEVGTALGAAIVAVGSWLRVRQVKARTKNGSNGEVSELRAALQRHNDETRLGYERLRALEVLMEQAMRRLTALESTHRRR